MNPKTETLKPEVLGNIYVHAVHNVKHLNDFDKMQLPALDRIVSDELVELANHYPYYENSWLDMPLKQLEKHLVREMKEYQDAIGIPQKKRKQINIRALSGMIWHRLNSTLEASK